MYTYEIELETELEMSALLKALSEHGRVSTLISKDRQPVKRNVAIEGEEITDWKRAFMAIHQHTKLGRNKANQLLQKYGAQRMVDLAPDKQAAFLEDAQALLATVKDEGTD